MSDASSAACQAAIAVYCSIYGDDEGCWLVDVGSGSDTGESDEEDVCPFSLGPATELPCSKEECMEDIWSAACQEAIAVYCGIYADDQGCWRSNVGSGSDTGGSETSSDVSESESASESGEDVACPFSASTGEESPCWHTECVADASSAGCYYSFA